MLGSLDGGRGKVEQLVDNVIAASSITLQERRPAAELDAYVPMILRDGALYDPDLDRFFRELPLHGVRSRHSLRAYGYDVLVWVRFLSEACAKTVWQADRRDVVAFHRARRRAEAGQRISAASWNRAVACLDRLYRWGVQEEPIGEAPFTHRSVWRQGQGRPLHPYEGGTVPSGFVFLHSPFPGSWDFRYFGPVPGSGVLGFARQVLTYAP